MNYLVGLIQSTGFYVIGIESKLIPCFIVLIEILKL